MTVTRFVQRVIWVIRISIPLGLLAAVLFAAEYQLAKSFPGTIWANFGNAWRITIFALFVANLGTAWRSFNKRDFVRVFGRRLMQESYAISIPEFELTENSRKVLEAQGLVSSRERFSPLHVGPNFKAGDIPRIIASSDIIGAAYMTDALGEFTRKGPRFEFHNDLFREGESFLSFGMQTNQHAPSFIDQISKVSMRRVLCRYNGNKAFLSPTAQKIAGIKQLSSVKLEPVHDGLSADILLETNNGEIRISGDHNKNWHVGLIIIITPKVERFSDLRWITISGVGHGGTSGASYFLANNWRKYVAHLGNSKNYDIVLSFTVTPVVEKDEDAKYQDEKVARDAATIELIRLGFG